MTSGCNLWVWLECIVAVSGCCCKEVYRYPLKNNYYFSYITPLVLALFWQQHPYFFVHLKNVFSFLFMLYLFNIFIANVAQRPFEIVQKSRSREYN